MPIVRCQASPQLIERAAFNNCYRRWQVPIRPCLIDIMVNQPVNQQIR